MIQLIILALNMSFCTLEQTVKMRVFDSFSNEIFLDSLLIQDGTILSTCDKENSIWLLPNEDGFYEFKVTCEGFSMQTNRTNYSELEIGGFGIYGKEVILIDSLLIFPFHGQDTTITRKSIRKKLRILKKSRVEKTVDITSFGDVGFDEKEAPREIVYLINGQKAKLTILEGMKSVNMSGHGKDEKGRKFGVYLNNFRFSGFYSNQF